MKNYSNNSFKFHQWIIVLIVVFLNSCNQQDFPPELIGQWKTGNVEITVRTQLERGRYEFTSDTVIITLNIDSNYTASGSLGLAEFENVKIAGLIDTSKGYLYCVKPFDIGKIFENDPKVKNPILFKLNLLDGITIKSELRERNFTMAEMIFTKEEDEQQ
jgi:hypothetical protein